MVAATFRHYANRNLDPQLHTHSVIANMAQNAEGQWRSVNFIKLEYSKLLTGAIGASSPGTDNRLIKKVGCTYKYYITKSGHSMILTVLNIRETTSGPGLSTRLA